MKSYLKFLSRNKLYTAVNVVGLSISLAFVIIIGLYAQMEFGRDKWHQKADRIYSVCTTGGGEVGEYSHWCMQELLRSRFPEIEGTCAVLNRDVELTLNNQEKKRVRMMSADTTFFQLFDFPLTLGSRSHALEKSNAIILSEETARLLRQFGIQVTIAFVVAIPILYYFGSDWLSQYSYRIALSPWIFVAAGGCCLTISLLTVLIQSWQTANENPIKNIKTE